MRAEAKIFRYSIFLTMIPLILSIGLVPIFSFAQQNTGFSDSNVPPYKQMANGELPHDVACKDDKVLILRYTGHPACINTATSDKWSSLGKVGPTSDCKAGLVALHNFNTGASLCEKKNNTENYVQHGWEIIDAVPPMKISTSECDASHTKLKNPGTGSIICLVPGGEAQKYLTRGWVQV